MLGLITGGEKNYPMYFGLRGKAGGGGGGGSHSGLLPSPANRGLFCWSICLKRDPY